MALKSLESDLPKKPRDCNSRKLDLSQWWLSCRSSQRTWKPPQKAGQNERSGCLTWNKCERKPGKCHTVVMRSGILIVQKLRKQLWWSCILIIKITCRTWKDLKACSPFPDKPTIGSHLESFGQSHSELNTGHLLQPSDGLLYWGFCGRLHLSMWWVG